MLKGRKRSSHRGNHPQRMEIQQSNWCTAPFGWDKIWATMERQEQSENKASAHCNHRRFAQLLTVLSSGDWHGIQTGPLGRQTMIGCLIGHLGWKSSVFSKNKRNVTSWIHNTWEGEKEALQACFWCDWVIFRSTVESSVSNEVKDFLSVPYFPPGTAAKCSESRGSDNLKLNMLWVIPSLKKVSGLKTLSAWQGHYLRSILLLPNHLLSPLKGSMWLYFHAQHQLKERTIGQRICAQQCHDVLICRCFKMSHSSVAPAKGSRARWLTNFGAHLHANPINCWVNRLQALKTHKAKRTWPHPNVI